MRVEIRSYHRRVRLDAAPLEDTESLTFLVPVGTSDKQVLEWCKDQPWVDQLRELLEAEDATPRPGQ